MKISALKCDRCPSLVSEERAKAEGWLIIGGGRRGRIRVDLCPYHAKQTIEELLEQQEKAKKGSR